MQDALAFLKGLALALYDPLQIRVLLALVGADVLLAVAVSLYKGQFILGMVADFLRTRIVPYFLAYTAVKVVALADPSLDLGVTLVWGAIIAAEVGRIVGHLKELGLPVPEVLRSPGR